MPIGCMMCDANFRINYWNPRAEKLFGYTQKEVLGKLPYDIFIPPSAKKYVQSLQRRLARGDFDANGVYECVTKDGLIIICEWYNTPIMDSNGKVAGYLAMARDITERKIAEESLRESENRFRTMADTAPVLIWMSGIDKKHFYFNKTWLNFTGRTLEEEFNNGWSKGIHPEDLKKYLKVYDASFDARTEFAMEYRLRRHDDEYRWILDTGVPRFTPDGRFLGYIGSCIDITERRKAEENLRESEARFRNMADNAPVMIWVTNADGVCHYQSQSWYEFTGLTPETGLNFGWKDAIHPEDSKRVFKNFIEANKKREYYTIEYRLRKKNGEYAWVFSSTSPRFGPQGEFLGFVGSIVDMTERKKTEEALRESEEQLRQSQKMEAIGKLAGGVAHDYNNLMAVIMLHADLLLAQTQDDDPQRHRIEEIRAATDRAAGLTRQLLAFSRKQVLQPRVLNLNAVVTDMNKMFHRLIGEDIELRTELDPDLGLVMADPDQMAQVIMNLVVNARDAMPQGGLLTIETENALIEEEGDDALQDSIANGSYVMLTISDTGCGIPEDIQQRVFEPFFTTKEHGKGTGLGLSTVYGIVKQSGGYVFMDSEQGQGTIFTIFLPRVDERVEVEEKEEPIQAANFRGNETVLLVEDEEMVRRVARDVLEKLGYKVLEAQSGPDALQMSDNYDGEVHLLLTDVVMPKMSGKELADKLTPARSGMKILYMSGYTDEAIVHHGVLEEGTNFIEKPFSPFKLAQKVRDVLNS
jgi:PAS domain S-box-containing protein